MTTSPPSVRRGLVARLLGPLLLVMAFGGASAYGLASHFSQAVLDQWLYDSAISLANRVRWEDGRATVDLPEIAREILEWDVVDRIYYEVISERGERLLGNAFIPPPSSPQPLAAPVYYDARIGEVPVRVLAVPVQVPHPEPAVVRIAETRLKRNALARQVLWISVALSVALAALSAGLVWHAIGKGMASMEGAVRRVRAAHAATPLAPIRPDEALPQEVLPLVLQINELIEDLTKAHRLNQRFIADAAHQLRTPLAALRVQLEVAQRERDPARHEQAVRDAVNVLARMGRTLHQLLTLARTDETAPAAAGQAGLVDLDAIAREEVERRLDDAVAARVDLGYAGAGRPVTVRGSAELVQEAVANLLDNALRYGARGGHVTVGVADGPPEVCVEDRGPGIPPEERDKVCRRFYRMPGTDGEGCGLGLAIVSEIARRHGGDLLLEDASPERGLRARIVFAGAGRANA
jgi:two-component system sensor histidine kinase TctE